MAFSVLKIKMASFEKDTSFKSNSFNFRRVHLKLSEVESEYELPLYKAKLFHLCPETTKLH